MKTAVRPRCPALIVGFIACLLASRPAGASLYTHEAPGVQLVSIGLSPTAAPVGGANQTGQFHALVIDEQNPDGYRVVKSDLSATRLGAEITIDLASANLYGASRLDGTVRRNALSLGVQATDGTIHRMSFTAVSEDQWNRKVARFKQEARLFRLGYAYRWWRNEEQQASARLAENKRELIDAKAQQAKVDQALERATAAHESGERRLAAAEKVNDAASALSDACDECNSVPETNSAKALVQEAVQAVRYVARHIREDEGAALGRLTAAQRNLEQKAQAIQSEPAASGDNSDARSAASDVRLSVSDVRLAVSDVRLALSVSSR